MIGFNYNMTLIHKMMEVLNSKLHNQQLLFNLLKNARTFNCFLVSSLFFLSSLFTCISHT